MKVYLSGKIGGLTFEKANEWRQDVTDRFQSAGIKSLNPLRGRLFQHADHHGEDINEIVNRDLRDVKNCDLVLVYLPAPVNLIIGTVCEIWQAYTIDKKPVILVTDDPYIIGHPWIKVAATKILPDLDTAVRYIIDRWNDDGGDNTLVPEKF